jgi:hypothetical protein
VTIHLLESQIKCALLVTENTGRTSFRSTLTQPSQMGNFKHQSLRDRDKDREEKDRERDSRDKDTHERLRHVRCSKV